MSNNLADIKLKVVYKKDNIEHHRDLNPINLTEQVMNDLEDLNLLLEAAISSS